MVGGITAAQLDDTDIPPLSWTVPGLLPEGFGILAAAPKIGKSWLMLGLAISVANGTPFLGVPVGQNAASPPVRYAGEAGAAEAARRYGKPQSDTSAAVSNAGAGGCREAEKRFGTKGKN